MGLAEIFEPIGEALKEDCRFVGPERKDSNSAPPWICWNPLGSRLVEPNQIRGDDGNDPIFTRQWAIEVEVWGKDLAALEALTDRFLAVAFEKLSRHSMGKLQPPEEIWNLGGVTPRGVQCMLRLFVLRPVLRTPPRLVSPTAIQVATGLDASAEQIDVTVTDP
jgi:hypothetical protein